MSRYDSSGCSRNLSSGLANRSFADTLTLPDLTRAPHYILIVSISDVLGFAFCPPFFRIIGSLSRMLAPSELALGDRVRASVANFLVS